MRKDKEASLPISDSEYARLYMLHKQRTDPNRRAPERVNRPPNTQPSVAGGRIVNWAQYLEAVERGEAKYPPDRRR